MLEALGEAGGLSTSDVILEAGHYDPDDKPSWKDGKPGGRSLANGSIWDDSAAYPHAGRLKYRRN